MTDAQLVQKEISSTQAEKENTSVVPEVSESPQVDVNALQEKQNQNDATEIEAQRAAIQEEMASSPVIAERKKQDDAAEDDGRKEEEERAASQINQLKRL